MRRIELPLEGTETESELRVGDVRRLKDIERRALITLASSNSVDDILPDAPRIVADIRRSALAAFECVGKALHTSSHDDLEVYRLEANDHLNHASRRIDGALVAAKGLRREAASGFGRTGGRGNEVDDKFRVPGQHRHAAEWSILVAAAIANYQLTFEAGCRHVARTWRDQPKNPDDPADKGKPRSWTTIRDAVTSYRAKVDFK